MTPRRTPEIWLTALTACVAVAGLLLAAFPASAPVELLVNRWAEAAFWPDASVTPAVAAYRDWVFGVTGAVIGGWGLLMLLVVRGPFRRREPWAWWAVALPVACWYAADTALSLIRGVPSNAVLNTVLLVLFAVPLLGTAGTFLGAAPREGER
ncbi:MAG: hypothetical protein PVJ02_19635 [Gemmatimonadota bacterium]|jgi:hypothetical protein